MCFRGMLQGLLTRRLPRAGIWMTALVFAAVHLQWSALPALFVLGLALGYVNKCHGFWAGVLLHGLYNAAVRRSVKIGITLPIVLVCTIAFIFAWRGLMQKEEPHHEADGTGL
ncbi:MAG: CPBP family intramembrane glutamic endopeptidase [Christensenellales bacterium]